MELWRRSLNILWLLGTRFVHQLILGVGIRRLVHFNQALHGKRLWWYGEDKGGWCTKIGRVLMGAVFGGVFDPHLIFGKWCWLV